MSSSFVDIENEVIITPEAVTNYVQQFFQFSRKTAEAIIQMAAVVYEANKKLNKGEFDLFCTGIRFDKDSSSIRKLIQIGKKSEYLQSHSNHLPGSWTTIYYLAQLSNEVLEEMIQDGEIYASMSGANAKQLVNKYASQTNMSLAKPKNNIPSSKSKTENGYALTIRFDNTPNPEKIRDMEEGIIRIIAVYGKDARLIRSNRLDDLLSA